MTYECKNCKFYQKGRGKHPHRCARTTHSCLWERAAKMERFSKGGDGHHIYTPVKDNCGYEGRFFAARS